MVNYRLYTTVVMQAQALASANENAVAIERYYQALDICAPNTLLSIECLMGIASTYWYICFISISFNFFGYDGI